jgi:hypothetical protein
VSMCAPKAPPGFSCGRPEMCMSGVCTAGTCDSR